jgi:alpha/beta superfamily hydrolase
MMMNWAADGGSKDIDALVALGFGGIIGFDAQQSIGDLKLPLLDIIGEQDFDAILANAPDRSTLVTATNKHSAQSVIAGADHFYNGKEQELVDLIYSWLRNL